MNHSDEWPLRGGTDGNSRGSTVDSPTDPGRFRHLVEHIQDAVVELEFVAGDPVVVGVNPSFVDLFGYEFADLEGDSLNDHIVPPWLSAEAAELDTRTTEGKINYSHVRRETADGLREFLYRGIPYELGDGTERGFAVYTDLTDDHRNESRLEVLNRLLRHNLRNRVNVITGTSELLVDELSGETADTAADLDAAATRLEKLATEAGEIHRTLHAPRVRNPRVDCVPLVERVAAQFRDAHPHATVDVDVPDRLVVVATERLETAVVSLVENAIEHNPAPAPRVWIEARMVGDGRWIELAVSDDGPRIPRTERDVVSGSAEITAVRHGSGLGLWLVKWTVERFGGDLGFAESEMGGNRVQVRLRRVTDGVT